MKDRNHRRKDRYTVGFIELLNFLPKDLNLTLVPGGEELLAADLPLADKEEEVITVDSSICLEEEVSNEQVCPVGGVVRDCKARVLKPKHKLCTQICVVF